MKIMKKRSAALFLAMAMAFGSVPALQVSAGAAENGPDDLRFSEAADDAESTADDIRTAEESSDCTGDDAERDDAESTDAALIADPDETEMDTVGASGRGGNETEDDTFGNENEGDIETPEIEIKPRTDISKASVSGVSLSYGYSGKAYMPALTVTVSSKTLTEGKDYSVKYENNVNPGTAKITITGKGNYRGTRIKTFEIVDCVSSLVSGKTYQLIPKNNSKTAVCSYSGRMVNNTKVYITDRSSSEAMRFVAEKNSDGTWKFINAKCELALAVQQNSSEAGKGLVLYRQTDRKAQNWKLVRKSDNSFAVINAVTGLSVAMSDISAVKGTTLSMAETASSGLQRFYIAETAPVDNRYDGVYAIKASANKNYALNISASSRDEGANVNLYRYSGSSAERFEAFYSGAGFYRLINVNSGLAVSVKGNTKANGANVVQSSWAAESGQRWKITENPDGTVTFTNALGTVLHLVSNSTKNNSNIVAKTAANTKAQRWYPE